MWFFVLPKTCLQQSSVKPPADRKSDQAEQNLCLNSKLSAVRFTICGCFDGTLLETLLLHRAGGRARRFVFVPPNLDGFMTVRKIVGHEPDWLRRRFIFVWCLRTSSAVRTFSPPWYVYFNTSFDILYCNSLFQQPPNLNVEGVINGRIGEQNKHPTS